MEEEYSCKKDASSKVISLLINLKDMDVWKVIMDKNIKENGKIISKMDRGNTPGRMAVLIKDSTEMVIEMAMEACTTKMDNHIREDGLKGWNMVKESIEQCEKIFVEHGVMANW